MIYGLVHRDVDSSHESDELRKKNQLFIFLTADILWINSTAQVGGTGPLVQQIISAVASWH